MSELNTRVIQVTNVAPSTTKDQLKTLFQFIGRIRDIKLFPPEGSDQQVAAKVCYVEFEDSTAAGVALHLTNTVFIDRALIVVPVMDGRIPDEKVAMQLTPQAASQTNPGQPTWPSNVVSQLTGTGDGQVLTTYDPRLNALSLPQYPPLPATLDAEQVEEIRRTVYIGNLDPQTTPQSLISFFSQAGEVKYVRMAGEDTSQSRAAYLELTDQRSVVNYLRYNGVNFSGRTITVSHAKSSINKPLTKSQEASRREVQEAMKKVHEAQSLISAATEKFTTRSRSKSRKRSRSRSRRRSRSRSRGRRRRSRSRSRRRSRSPRRVRRSRSRSPRRRRSRSRSGLVLIPAREREPILLRRRRSRSGSRSRRRSRSRSRRRSRTPPKAYSGRRSRSRSRGPARRKSRSRTPRRSRSPRGRGKDRKEKEKQSEKKKKEKKAPSSRSPSPPTLKREGSTDARSGDDRSPVRPSSSEAASDKKAVEKKRNRSVSPSARRGERSVSRSPARGGRKRSVSRSPVKASRRRSLSPRKPRSKSRSPRRSRSPAKKKKARSPRRSRSGSRQRSKKEKKKERSRSRERKEKKKRSKEKREEKEKEKESFSSSSSSKAVTRDYDEEERGYNSASDRGEDDEMRSQGSREEDRERRECGGVDTQLVDMDTSD